MRIFKNLIYFIIAIGIFIGIINNNVNIHQIEQKLKLTTATIKDDLNLKLFGGILTYKTVTVRNFENNNSIESSIIKTNIFKPKNITEQYYKNLNQLLKISNPTKVDLQNIKLTQWIGDKKKFFTLIFKNKSALPAHFFDVKIFDNNKTISFKHNKSSNIFYNKPTISANKIFEFPLVSIDELAKYFNVDKNAILGMGISPNIPSNISNKAKISRNKYSYSKVRSIPLGLKYTYKTIFNDTISTFVGIYVYLDVNLAKRLTKHRSR